MNTDDTPPYPTEIPEERPTSPDLAVGLKCPECQGQGFILTIVELNEDGYLDHAAASPCSLCKTARTVTRSEFRRWHATRSGRP